MKQCKNIDEYISIFPVEVQKKLEKLRVVILDTAPDSLETISYGIPTFKLNGKNLVHFAAYATHIGFYPGSQAIEEFADQLVGFKTSKGTIQFPIEKKIPYELIGKITKYNVAQIVH